MAAISSPSPSTLSASLTPHRLPSPAFRLLPSLRRRPLPLALSAKSPNCPDPKPNSNPNPNANANDLAFTIEHEAPLPKWKRGSAVYVTLPVDVLDAGRRVRRPRAMRASLKTLAMAGVEGVVMEVWWGLVESDEPRRYDWGGYVEIVEMARGVGLKVRAVMAFHQVGVAGDPCWIPLPFWVRMAILEDPDLVFSDRFGRRNHEYITVGCDVLPVLRGRSPIQTYSDFMRSFRDTFREYFGVTITGVQVGMGPAGELRYPACPSKKLESSWRVRELGEFQCYDKYMLASLNARAEEVGMRDWGNRGPVGTGNLMHNPEETQFFRSDGSWNTPYGRFFLEWYSGMLLLHGERLCIAATNIFSGTGASVSAKLAGMHWHYGTKSHPSELTAGYYNTCERDGYLPITRLFSKYSVILCCPCFELRDRDEKLIHPLSSPEQLLKQILLAAKASNLPLDAENSANQLDDQSFQQMLKMSKFYSNGLDEVFFSFNFVRMGKHFFERHNFVRFAEFVKQISPANNFQAKLCNSAITTAKKYRSAVTFY